MLRFCLLGTFEARRDGELIPAGAWRTRQTLAVLKLLLGERGRLVPFERLADLVWPESDPTAARTSLRGAIRTLRRVLEPAMLAGGASRHVVTEPAGYRLVEQPGLVDVDDFRAACQRGVAAERRGDRAEAIQVYREAAALYRGDYLADDPYADWALEPRERLRGRFLDALDRLSALLADAGSPGEAIGYLDRAIAVDPLREELYCQLMRCQAAAGRRSHALAVYEQCRRVLASELGVDPAPETRRLRDTIAQTRPGAGAVERQTEAGAPAAELRAVFVGREAELADLHAVWRRAPSWGGQLVVTRGPAGIGKTRLLRRFAELARPVPHTLWFTAHEGEGEFPFGTILAELANWLDRTATVTQLQRLGPYAPVLAHLLPQVRAIWPACPPLGRDRPESSQLLEAVTQTVRLLLGPGPALLVVDDLHWADRSTVLWLGYALRRWPAGTLVAATLRTGEPASQALTAFLDRLRGAEQLAEFDLGPLSPADVERLIAAIQPEAGAEAALGRRLHDATRGNPLFLRETLRELQRRGRLGGGVGAGDGAVPPGAERGAGAAELGDELPLPAGVREAIRARGGVLDEPARDTLAVLGVIGGACRADLVADVLAVAPEAALARLEILLQRQLIHVSDDGHGYVVEHPLVRRVIYDDLGPGRRQHWHRRVAAAMAARLGRQPATAVRVLRHLLAGEADDAAIVRAGLLAGDHALSQYAYGEAIECLTAVRSRLGLPRPGTAAADADAWARATEQWAEALAGLGRWDEAIAGYEQLLHGPLAGEPLARARLRRKLAHALAEPGARGLDRALAVLATAEADLTGLTGAAAQTERGRIERIRSLAYLNRGEYQASVDAGERALAAWAGLPGVELFVLDQEYGMAHAEQRLGWLDRVVARQQRVLAHARTLGDAWGVARFSEGLGLARLHRGELREAEPLLAEGLRAYRALGVPRAEMNGRHNRGYLLSLTGELGGARAAYEAALGIAEALQASLQVVISGVGLGEILVHLGEFEPARDWLERALGVAASINTQMRVGHAHLHLGELALWRGDPEAARAAVERGLDVGAAIGDSYTVRVGCPVLARAWLALGHPAEAEAAARRGLEAAQTTGFALDEGRGRLALGLALGTRGDTAAALAAIAQAERTFRTAGARYLLALALAEQADLLQAARPAAAAAARREAATLAAAAGAQPLLSRLTASRRRPATRAPR